MHDSEITITIRGANVVNVAVRTGSLPPRSLLKGSPENRASQSRDAGGEVMIEVRSSDAAQRDSAEDHGSGVQWQSYHDLFPEAFESADSPTSSSGFSSRPTSSSEESTNPEVSAGAPE